MNIEDKIKQELRLRGFTKEQLLNNRGLIGATIDETILELVKNLAIHDVSSSVPFEFIEWYSGMERKKIMAAHSRWLKEKE